MFNPEHKFEAFPKIARLSRNIVVTEKIDGTNAQVFITEDGDVIAGSRTRYITPDDDNYGFARWVEGNKQELLKLGQGRHYGEWWGLGIQRGYNVDKKIFSLFNTHRWKDEAVRPQCCSIVPILYEGIFSQFEIDLVLQRLRTYGSQASRFMNPEGIVVYHRAANLMFKKTLDKDEEPKGKSQ